MRLPVAATDETPEGFTWTRDGELVMAAFTCDRDADGDSDGGCGCGRAFAGIASHRATTRAVIASVPVSQETVCAIVRESLARGGWMPACGELTQEQNDMLSMVVTEMVEIGEMFPEGTHLARHRDDVFPVV